MAKNKKVTKKDIRRATKYNDQEAEFIASIENGEIPGDVNPDNKPDPDETKEIPEWLKS